MTEFETIYRRYFTDVELYLRAVCHDEVLAEELTEQVFFQALKALPKFRGDCDIRTWLCAMARNCYISHLRKTRPMEDIDEIQIPDPRRGIEEQIEDKQQAMAIHRVLHDLPEPYKEVFSLRVFGQLSFEDIGGLFGRTAPRGKQSSWSAATGRRFNWQPKRIIRPWRSPCWPGRTRTSPGSWSMTLPKKPSGHSWKRRK